MRRRPFAKTVSSKAVLLMLLALQLVVGLQLQAAQAVTMPMSPKAMPMGVAMTPIRMPSTHMPVAPMQMPVGSGMPSSLPTAVATAGAAAQPDCPTHSAHLVHSAHGAAHSVRASANLPGSANLSGANLSGVHEHTFEHAPSGKHAPMGTGTHEGGTHDCCQASACQCHCVYTPGSIALPALANIATSVAIPSLASARVVAPRIDEFLRPPIV